MAGWSEAGGSENPCCFQVSGAIITQCHSTSGRLVLFILPAFPHWSPATRQSLKRPVKGTVFIQKVGEDCNGWGGWGGGGALTLSAGRAWAKALNGVKTSSNQKGKNQAGLLNLTEVQEILQAKEERDINISLSGFLWRIIIS